MPDSNLSAAQQQKRLPRPPVDAEPPYEMSGALAYHHIGDEAPLPAHGLAEQQESGAAPTTRKRKVSLWFSRRAASLRRLNSGKKRKTTSPASLPGQLQHNGRAHEPAKAMSSPGHGGEAGMPSWLRTEESERLGPWPYLKSDWEGLSSSPLSGSRQYDYRVTEPAGARPSRYRRRKTSKQPPQSSPVRYHQPAGWPAEARPSRGHGQGVSMPPLPPPPQFQPVRYHSRAGWSAADGPSYGHKRGASMPSQPSSFDSGFGGSAQAGPFRGLMRDAGVPSQLAVRARYDSRAYEPAEARPSRGHMRKASVPSQLSMRARCGSVADESAEAGPSRRDKGKGVAWLDPRLVAPRHAGQGWQRRQQPSHDYEWDATAEVPLGLLVRRQPSRDYQWESPPQAPLRLPVRRQPSQAYERESATQPPWMLLAPPHRAAPEPRPKVTLMQRSARRKPAVPLYAHTGKEQYHDAPRFDVVRPPTKVEAWQRRERQRWAVRGWNIRVPKFSKSV